jgi:hypothetical protein
MLILSPFVALYISVIIYFISLNNFIRGAWDSFYKEDEYIKEEDPTNIWDRHIAKMKLKNDLK